MSEPFITVENLSKSYKKGRVKAVDGISFQVNRGDCFGLIGPNGAGKTTVIGCLLGLLHPTNVGTISIDGYSPYDEEVKLITGFLPERPSYNRWMTVRHFLKFHHRLAEQPADHVDAAIDEALTMVELDPVVVKTRRVRELSRGMLQRVGLAQALIGKPKLCFFDEPTQGMDPLGFMLVRKLLLKLKDEGVTVILNSHHLHEVERVCDRVAFIRAGKIEAVEALGANLDTKHIFVIRWAGTEIDDTTGGDQELKLKRVEDDEISLLEHTPDTARFSVTNEKCASRLMRKLLVDGLPIYESNFEKRSLVELFLRETTPEGSADE